MYWCQGCRSYNNRDPALSFLALGQASSGICFKCIERANVLIKLYKRKQKKDKRNAKKKRG